MDLFGNGNATPAPPGLPAQASAANMFGGMTSPPPQVASPATGGPPAHHAYNKNGLQIAFQLRRDAQAVQVLARFRNNSEHERLSNVSLQAAVPKSQKLQLQAISSGELDGGQEATQQMRITGVNGVSFLLCTYQWHAHEYLATTGQIAIASQGWLHKWLNGTCERTGGLG